MENVWSDASIAWSGAATAWLPVERLEVVAGVGSVGGRIAMRPGLAAPDLCVTCGSVAPRINVNPARGLVVAQGVVVRPAASVDILTYLTSPWSAPQAGCLISTCRPGSVGVTSAALASCSAVLLALAARACVAGTDLREVLLLASPVTRQFRALSFLPGRRVVLSCFITRSMRCVSARELE